MIRVLHLTGTSAVGDGVPASLLALYQKMDRTRFTFDLLTFSRGSLDYETDFCALGGRVLRMSPPTARHLFKYVRELSDAFARQPGYTVAHCHVPALCGPFFFAAKCAGVPLRILHSHSTAWSAGGWDKALRNAVGTHMGRHIANAYMACSDEAADFLFGKRGKAEIIPPAVDTGHFAFCTDVRAQTRKMLGCREQLVIGHVGRFTPEKNHLFLLDVFSCLHRICPESILLLVGDGPQRAYVEKACREKGLGDAVRFVGTRRRVAPFLQAMDVFVFPSMFEGFGAALLEALAAGLPCVVSDALPHTAQLLPGVTALPLYDSVESWAEHILAVRGRLSDPDLSARGYDVSVAAARLSRFYQAGLRQTDLPFRSNCDR
ncbi:MAG: glycosyltransferase [Ethanoligenens sp.]